MKSFLKPPIELRRGYKDKKRLALIHFLPCQVCEKLDLKQKSRTIAHHKIGMGLGKKASDLLTTALCENHHNKSSEGIHNMPLDRWENKFFTQDQLIEFTNESLKKLVL